MRKLPQLGRKWCLLQSERKVDLNVLNLTHQELFHVQAWPATAHPNIHDSVYEMHELQVALYWFFLSDSKKNDQLNTDKKNFQSSTHFSCKHSQFWLQGWEDFSVKVAFRFWKKYTEQLPNLKCFLMPNNAKNTNFFPKTLGCLLSFRA